MTTPAAELGGLVAAFERAELEERPTLPLLDALEAAGAVAAAPELARGDREARLLAARVMELLPDESYVPALAALMRDADPAVAEAARTAFAGQRRTPEWHAVAE